MKKSFLKVNSEILHGVFSRRVSLCANGGANGGVEHLRGVCHGGVGRTETEVCHGGVGVDGVSAWRDGRLSG